MNRLWVVLLILSVGCGTPAVTPVVEPSVSILGEGFDGSRCGSLTGRILWEGPLPETLPSHAPRKPGNFFDKSPVRPWPNPNTPRVNPSTGGLRDVVVSLRGVDAKRSRVWDWPSVRVEIAEGEIHVVQGEPGGRTGFVRAGQPVEMVSQEASLHLLRGRGAAHFSQPLTQVGVVRQRTFGQPGVIELSSGSGYFWMRGYLVVTDHPYHAVSDGEGQFSLTDVPAGEYDLIAWMPNWRERDYEINGDTGYRVAVRYQEPLRVTQRVAVSAGHITAIPPITFRAIGDAQ